MPISPMYYWITDGPWLIPKLSIRKVHGRGEDRVHLHDVQGVPFQIRESQMGCVDLGVGNIEMCLNRCQ